MQVIIRMKKEYELIGGKPNIGSYYRGRGVASEMQLVHLNEGSILLFPHINHFYHRGLPQLQYDVQGLNHLPKNKTKS